MSSAHPIGVLSKDLPQSVQQQAQMNPSSQQQLNTFVSQELSLSPKHLYLGRATQTGPSLGQHVSGQKSHESHHDQNEMDPLRLKQMKLFPDVSSLYT